MASSQLGAAAVPAPGAGSRGSRGSPGSMLGSDLAQPEQAAAESGAGGAGLREGGASQA